MLGANAQATSEVANEHFVNGRYAEAAPLYRELLVRFPEDATYSYRLGVASFLSNDNLNEVYKYLKQSSTKEVPVKVYFYLGEVCRYLYRFDESLAYYKRFVQNGGSSDVSTVELELAAGATTNGQNMLRYGANVTPVAKAMVAKPSFYKTFDTYSADAGFAVLPDNLKTGSDRKHGNASLMFAKKNGGVAGDIVVFASYGQGETSSKDLYYIQKMDDGKWSAPRRLPESINSPFDEEYPYMCPDNRTLYFASKGLYGVGGFDIYKTVFNSDDNSWSAPENMGYPINSPYDDFLFVPSDDGLMGCFASSRGVRSVDSVMVYKVGGLDRALKLSLTESMALRMQALDVISEAKPLPAGDEGNGSTPREEKQVGVELLPEYRKIKEAILRTAAQLDSTTRKVERLRVVWSDLPDSMRADVQRLIVFNENKIAEYSTLGSQLAARASLMERDYLSGKLRPDTTMQPFNGEWFLACNAFRAIVSDEHRSRLQQSPLGLSRAMQLLDSIPNISTQLDDLAQMLSVAKSEEEKERITTTIAELNGVQKSLLGEISVKWGSFYSQYYGVMLEISRAAARPSTSMLLINQAQHCSMLASGIRRNSITEEGFAKQKEAFDQEQKSLNLLNLFLAQVGGNKALADSLSNILGTIELEESKSIPEKASQFGTLLRDDVVFADLSVSAPANHAEFMVNPATIYSNDLPIPGVKILPKGICYSVQLGMFSQSLTYSLFRFSPMFYDVASNGHKKVYAGIFSTYQNAQNSLKHVKENGFKDAFIVAFANGRPTPVSLARQQESRTPTAPVVPIAADSPAIYRVVIGTFDGEMPTNIKAIVQKLLSDKELINSVLSSGETTYSIGNFDNFEEAIPLKNLLISEGVVEAFVTKIELNRTVQ